MPAEHFCSLAVLMPSNNYFCSPPTSLPFEHFGSLETLRPFQHFFSLLHTSKHFFSSLQNACLGHWILFAFQQPLCLLSLSAIEQPLLPSICLSLSHDWSSPSSETTTLLNSWPTVTKLKINCCNMLLVPNASSSCAIPTPNQHMRLLHCWFPSMSSSHTYTKLICNALSWLILSTLVTN